MAGALGHQLYACGEKGPPEKLEFAGFDYKLSKLLKHDFFAATALYRASGNGEVVRAGRPAKIILKLARQHHFLGIPLRWFGQWLCGREVSNLARLKSLRGVPQVLSGYDKCGFLYEYIEGHSLDENGQVPEDFFDELMKLVQQVHHRGLVYLDMNKRGNILLGADGKPHLIDFQISVHIGEGVGIFGGIIRRIRNSLQRCDIYHLFKHKRRFCPEHLRPEEEALSRCGGRLIRLHRLIATPFRSLRRGLLKYLYRNGHVTAERNGHYSRENDPARFLK